MTKWQCTGDCSHDVAHYCRQYHVGHSHSCGVVWIAGRCRVVASHRWSQSLNCPCLCGQSGAHPSLISWSHSFLLSLLQIIQSHLSTSSSQHGAMAKVPSRSFQWGGWGKLSKGVCIVCDGVWDLVSKWLTWLLLQNKLVALLWAFQNTVAVIHDNNLPEWDAFIQEFYQIFEGKHIPKPPVLHKDKFCKALCGELARIGKLVGLINFWGKISMQIVG